MARTTARLHLVRAIPTGDTPGARDELTVHLSEPSPHSSPPRLPRRAPGPWVAACVVPAVLGLAWLGLGGFFAPDPPVPAPSEEALKLHAGIPQDVDVVVLGNSQAYAAIEPSTLQQALGSGPVGAITIANARPYLLTKLLDHHVFRAGRHPRLVVFPIGWDHLVSTQAPRPDQEVTWAAELADVDAALDGRIVGRQGAATGLARVQRASIAVKDAVLDAVTRLPAVLQGAGNAEVAMDEARQVVIGDATLGNAALAVRMIPVVEHEGPVRAQEAAAGDGLLDASVLPDLARLVQDHGARLVVVSLPQRRPDLRLTAANERALLAWVADHGAAYVDLASAPVAVTEWRDEGHVVRAVAQRLTERLAERLKDLGALGDAPMQAGRTASQPDLIARTGTLPAVVPVEVARDADPCVLTVVLPDRLAPLGDAQLLQRDLGAASPLVATYDGAPLQPQVLQRSAGSCDGSYGSVGAVVTVRTPTSSPDPAALALTWTDAVTWATRPRRMSDGRTGAITWIPEGTGLSWTLSDRAALGDDVHVELAALEVVPGTSPPTLSVAGQPAPLDHVGDLWRARVDVPAGSGALEVTLTAPPDGWLVVRSLSVAHGTDVDAWVGTADARGDSVVLAGSTTARVQTPDDVRVIPGDVVDQDGQLALSIPDDLAVAGPDQLIARFGMANFGVCTPLGVRSRGADATYARAVTWRPNRPSIARPADAPKGVGWDLVLQPARGCFSNTWVYPGETATFSPPSAAALATPGRWLVVQWGMFAPGGSDTVRVRLLANGRALLDELVEVGPDQGRLVLPLAPQVPASPSQLSLELTSAGRGLLFVRHAAVSYDEPEAPTPMAAPTEAAPAPAEAAPVPTIAAVTTDLLATDGVVDGFKVFPPDHAALAMADDALSIRIDDGAFTRICGPLVPVSPGVAVLAADVATDDAAPRFLSLELGWFRAGERLVEAARPRIDRVRVDLSGDSTPVGGRFDVPADADGAVPCLVRTKGDPTTLTLRSWQLGTP